MNSVVDKIEGSKYAATEAQVEQLAAEASTGERAGGTYLRVLVAKAQDLLRMKKGGKRKASAAVDAAHAMFYPAVVRGVGGEALARKECHRRATFARSAATTLRGFVRGGGSLIKLVPAEVTKASLRAAIAPAKPQGDRQHRICANAQAQLVRALQRMEPAAARDQLEATISELQSTLEQFEPRIVRSRVQRVPAGERAAATVN